jgi:deferrochelatase/peroxidase EfeB
MDKWDEIIHRIQQGILAEEPEAAMTAALQLFAEFGRTLEQLGADVDRIATTFENQQVEISGSAEPPVLDL